jgi:predicted lipid-binding transport protein (Tim44 family)
MLMPGLVMLGSQAAGWVRGGRAAWRQRQGRRATTLATPGARLPAGLDAAALIDTARDQFLRLQAAWDAGDEAVLAALTTPQMLAELREQMPAPDAPPNRTEVLSLQVRLLGVDDLGSVWLASIEFSGTVCESPDRPVAPLRELWLMTREQAAFEAATSAPWRLARQQALL